MAVSSPLGHVGSALGSPWLRISQAAAYAGISLNTVKSLRRRGLFVRGYMIGRIPLFAVDEIDSWVRSRRENLDKHLGSPLDWDRRVFHNQEN